MIRIVMNYYGLIALTTFLLFTYSAASTAADKGYRFGVFPYLSPLRMDQIYSPASQQLSKTLNQPVKFRTSSSFQKFLKKLKAGFFDFALIQPFWYPIAVDQHNYLPAVRMQEPFISLVMVLDTSKYKHVNDLKGTTIATPPMNVPVVHMARQTLIDNNIIPGKDIKFAHFNSVDSCFQQVLIGKASACVAPPFAPAVFEKSMKIKLRTLLKSSSIPNLSLVVHSRVPEQDREKIQREFLSWSSSDEGRAILEKMQTGGFIPLRDKDYDVVRELKKSLNI